MSDASEAPKQDGAVVGETVFPGVQAGGSLSVAEVLAKDAEDESLQRYKASLLGAAAQGDLGDASDTRKLVVCDFSVIFAPEEGRPEINHNLDTKEGLEKLQKEGITMKEGAKFKFRIGFRVYHQILPGLKFINAVSKTMFTEKEELMVGSYPPSSTANVFEFPRFDYSEAPKGMLYRGKYSCCCSFVDAENVKHLEVAYALNIKSDW